MPYETKPGDVALFKFVPRDFREGVKYPSMTGYMVAHRNIREGEKIDLAVWTREPKSGGAKFLSGEAKDPRQPNGNGASSPPSQADDDMPF